MQKIKFDISDDEIDTLMTNTNASTKFLEAITKEIYDWLFTHDLEIVTDIPEEEMVTVAGGTLKGHGHVAINLYFKNK